MDGKFMKRFKGLVVCVLLSVTVWGQESKPYTFLLTGASFASPNNRWFEMGCENLGVNGINRAVSGESIFHTANRMEEGVLYSFEEFEKIDALVIMHVHEKDVYNQDHLKDNYKDYALPMDGNDYAACFDYVIKRYISECYLLKDNPRSKYYGSKYGKPAVIILCTHWNDSRVIYNSTVRKLGEKWGIPVVEFDKYIGFSVNQKHPVKGEPYSLIYTDDRQMMHDRPQGWHPHQGEHSFLQRRMASVFADMMRRLFLL